MGAGGYLPNYPASDESDFEAIGLPYVVYRGKFFRAGDKGLLRGRLLNTRDFELDISLAGSFSVDSDENSARRGMEDIDWLGEVGPRIQWRLARAARWAKIDLELPIRVVFSTDFSDVSYEGLLLAPEIAYQHDNFLESGAQVKVGISATFANEDLQDLFYEVDRRFATAQRRAFDADAGYLGTKIQFLLLKPFAKRFTLFAAAKVDFHQGAANEDSPLFRDDLTYSAGVGLIVSLFQSKQMVSE